MQSSIPLSFATLVVLLVLAGCSGESQAPPVPETPTATTVQLTLDFGGEQPNRTLELEHAGGATLFETFRRAREAGNLEFASKGDDLLPFVESIDGVENEGGGAGARNWQFWVNGEYSDVGIGQFEPKPGDEVQWKFTTSAAMKEPSE